MDRFYSRDDTTLTGRKIHRIKPIREVGYDKKGGEELEG
jgi:hypothetical protein